MYRYHIDLQKIKEYVDIFIIIATNMIGRQIQQSNGNIIFNSLFGVTPFVCGVTWFLLINNQHINTNIEPVHLLWSLFFMKNYVKEEVLRAQFNNPDKKIIRDRMWNIIDKISRLSSIVVSIY